MLQYFPMEKIIACAKKAKTGLGIGIGKSTLPNSRIIKLKTTGRKGAGRVVYILITDNESGQKITYPILFRLKKDKKIGENFSFKNKAFKEAYDKNLFLILEDLRSGNFKEYDL